MSKKRKRKEERKERRKSIGNGAVGPGGGEVKEEEEEVELSVELGGEQEDEGQAQGVKHEGRSRFFCEYNTALDEVLEGCSAWVRERLKEEVWRRHGKRTVDRHRAGARGELAHPLRATDSLPRRRPS